MGTDDKQSRPIEAGATHPGIASIPEKFQWPTQVTHQSVLHTVLYAALAFVTLRDGVTRFETSASIAWSAGRVNALTGSDMIVGGLFTVIGLAAVVGAVLVLYGDRRGPVVSAGTGVFAVVVGVSVMLTVGAYYQLLYDLGRSVAAMGLAGVVVSALVYRELQRPSRELSE